MLQTMKHYHYDYIKILTFISVIEVNKLFNPMTSHVTGMVLGLRPGKRGAH